MLLISYYSFSQPTFYILSGGNITKVEDGDPSRLNVIEWRILLYKRGAAKTGTSYWGAIKGSTSEEVMEKLKQEQKFELDFNKFIGKGKVEDAVFTHFNPLGPIAVIDDTKASELPLTESQKNVADLYTKAVDLFYTGLDAKNNLDVIIKGKENPYADIGSNFMQYSEGIKDAVLQIRTLQNLLFKNSTTTLQNINKQLTAIDRKLTNAQIKQTKITTALSNINTGQNQKTTSNNISGSPQSLISNIPSKFRNSVNTVLESGREISAIQASIPTELTTGMNEQQKIYFKDFVEQINYYWKDMAYCFGLMSEGSVGYGYLDNNKILIDVTDQYYRDDVFKNPQIFETSNYNTYYSQALLDKANAAYCLFKLIEHEPTATKQVKTKLLNYGLSNANMIYQEAIDGYQIKYVLTQKQEIISKIKQSLK